MEEESFPVHRALTVVDGITLYKTEKWWKAVVLTEAFGKKTLSVYQWIKDNKGAWKRKQKMSVRNRGDWLELKEAVEKLLEKL